MADQGVWYQEVIDGKQVWHFYPTPIPGAYPFGLKDQWKLACPVTANEQTKAIVWKSTKEVPLPANGGAVTVHGKTIVLHAPGSFIDQAQALVPVGQNDVSYFSNCIFNYYNNHNCIGAIEAAAKAKEESKTEGEGVISITEDEVKLDAMLHEQAQAIRQLHYLHTVDYGAGDVYGRRYIMQ